MARRIYFDEHINYLRGIAPGQSSREITDMFNEKFGMTATRDAIRTLLVKNKIRTGASKGNPKGMQSKVYPREVEDFIKDNYIGVGPKEMMGLVNAKFTTSYTHTQLKGYYARNKLNSGLNGYYKKGEIPWNKGLKGYMGPNKTSFKKGNVPSNYRPVGSERVDKKDGYTLIKVQDHGTWPERWRHKHVVIWEEANGPVPDGYVVLFGDGDKSNISLDNLILVSRAQLARLNQYNLIQSHADLTKVALNIVDLNVKISERKKENKEER